MKLTKPVTVVVATAFVLIPVMLQLDDHRLPWINVIAVCARHAMAASIVLLLACRIVWRKPVGESWCVIRIAPDWCAIAIAAVLSMWCLIDTLSTFTGAPIGFVLRHTVYAASFAVLAAAIVGGLLWMDERERNRRKRSHES